MIKIKGTTKITGLIGYPVSHSFSPAMHNAAFQKAGIDWAYIPFPVLPEKLGDAVRGLPALGIIGANVTIPHKEKVIEYLDIISDEAALIGAVNTIRVQSDSRLFGTNTDALGFQTAVEKEWGIELSGRKIAIFGAGGVSKAFSVVCALANVLSIAITDVDMEKCRTITSIISSANKKVQVNAFRPCEIQMADAVKKADLIINATPIGMHEGDLSPCPFDWLPEKGYAYDAIYNPSETPFLLDARKKGLKTQNGLSMLLHQGAAAYEIWTGFKPDISVMKKALFEALGR